LKEKHLAQFAAPPKSGAKAKRMKILSDADTANMLWSRPGWRD